MPGIVSTREPQRQNNPPTIPATPPDIIPHACLCCCHSCSCECACSNRGVGNEPLLQQRSSRDSDDIESGYVSVPSMIDPHIALDADTFTDTEGSTGANEGVEEHAERLDTNIHSSLFASETSLQRLNHCTAAESLGMLYPALAQSPVFSWSHTPPHLSPQRVDSSMSLSMFVETGSGLYSLASFASLASLQKAQNLSTGLRRTGSSMLAGIGGGFEDVCGFYFVTAPLPLNFEADNCSNLVIGSALGDNEGDDYVL